MSTILVQLQTYKYTISMKYKFGKPFHIMSYHIIDN
jgi:hypothetical protein